jgi:hypothetical protein
MADAFEDSGLPAIPPWATTSSDVWREWVASINKEKVARRLGCTLEEVEGAMKQTGGDLDKAIALLRASKKEKNPSI